MKNFIFDLYGTLVDISTDEGSERFRKRYLAYFNKINPGKDFFAEYFTLCESLIKDGDENCEIDLLSVFKALAGDKCEAAAKRFRKLSTNYLKLYNGVKPFLSKLKSSGARLYILSNAQSCFTRDELKKLKITRFFDGIELSSDFGRKKPDKSFFERIIEKYSLNAEECIFIGNDVCADLHGAKAASLRSAYILSNLSPECDTLEKAGEYAGFVCDSHKKLFDYLLSLQ